MAVRYALLAGHPRKQLNFTLESVHAAEKALSSLRAHRAALAPAAAAHDAFAPVIAALQDDLNTPAALGALFSLVNRKDLQADLTSFDRALFALGLDLTAPAPQAKVTAPAEVTALAEKRWAAKQAKDFATADA